MHRPLAIEDDEIHVWRAALDPAVDVAADMARWLDAEERARAARFHQDRDRRRFVIAHAVLRLLLGGYCRCDPGALRFGLSPRGKPFLREPTSDLRFNLSHSGELAIYGLTRGAEIGIDVEQHRTELAADRIADRHFAPAEVAALQNLPPHQQSEAFFRCWTRKEAFIKALGEGLSKPLDSFRVSLLPEAPAASVYVAGDPAATAKWSLHSLVPAEGYVAALAVPMPQCHVSIFPRLTATDLLNSTAGPGAFPPPAESL